MKLRSSSIQLSGLLFLAFAAAGCAADSGDGPQRGGNSGGDRDSSGNSGQDTADNTDTSGGNDTVDNTDTSGGEDTNPSLDVNVDDNGGGRKGFSEAKLAFRDKNLSTPLPVKEDFLRSFETDS